MQNTAAFIRQQLRNTIPRKRPTRVVPWVETHCRFPGSPLGPDFRIEKTPWCRQPLEDGNRPGVRRVVYVKPIQSGGSTIGEALICFWSYHWPGGSIGYFWPNNLASELRWKKQTERVLKACKPLQEKLPADNPNAWIDGLIRFNHLNLEMKGVNTDRSVASDTLRAVICEEVHDVNSGWDPGRLRQVFGRMTAYWNSIAYVISNAGHKGSELHKAFEGGTQRHWMVRCPGCSNLHHEANWVYHAMRTRWDHERPDLGGLRYELPEDRKRGDDIDYQQVARTVRYQMPCGYVVQNDKTERRNLSLVGRYSEPTNTKAQPGHESYTMEGVSVDYIDWLTLIEEKNLALRARKLGDPKPWLVYLRERECQFVGVDDRRPEAVPIILSSRKKDREGLPNRQWRLAAIDYQVGRKDLGETPHFWVVIQDFEPDGATLIVWEGKCESEGEVLDVLRRHDVKPICTLIDASFTGEDRYIYFFALKHGFNAIKVHGERGTERTFMHGDGVRRNWSEPEPLWPRAANQQGPTRENPDEEPEFWNISQAGAMDALAHLRARKIPDQTDPKKDRTAYEIPSDVSEDFKLHFGAWSLTEYRVPATNQIELRWKKSAEKAPDHLFMCCTYLALWGEMAGAIGATVEAGIASAVISEQQTNENLLQ